MCGEWGEKGFLRRLGGDDIKRELTTTQMIALINKIATFRPYVSFFGGEPLLREDIGEIVKHCSTRNLLTTMNSNGLLLKEKAEELVKGGLGFYRGSLDGPRGVNEKIRVSPNSYDKAVGGLNDLIDVRRKLRRAFPIVQVCTTITKENQYHLLETAKIVNEIGVDIFALLFGIFTTDGLVRASNEISKKALGFEWRSWEGFVLDRLGMDVRAIQDQVNQIKGSKWRFRYRQYPPETRSFNIDAHYNHPERCHGGGLCVLPWVRMEVMPNGDVALCEDTPDYIAGNILENDPLDIWNGQRYVAFRRHIKEKGIFPVCTRCSALYEVPHYVNEVLPQRVFALN